MKLTDLQRSILTRLAGSLWWDASTMTKQERNAARGMFHRSVPLVCQLDDGFTYFITPAGRLRLEAE
jgi:hypothetical protein